MNFISWDKIFSWSNERESDVTFHVVVFDYFFSFLRKSFSVGWVRDRREVFIGCSSRFTQTVSFSIAPQSHSRLGRRACSKKKNKYIFITSCDRQNSLYLLDVHLTKSFDLLRVENIFTFTKNIAANVMSISVSHSLCLRQFLMGSLLRLASCVF